MHAAEAPARFPRRLDPTTARYARRAVRLLAVAARFPIAAVTFADAHGRQQLFSYIGVEGDHSDALLRCCEQVSSRPGLVVFTDLGRPTPVAPSTPATAGVTFFAGISIRVADGIGVMCVMGPTRAAWNAASEAALIEVHAWLEDTLEALRIGKVDHLTGLANRRDLEEVMEREWRRAIRDSTPISVLSIDIDHFKKFNDAYGHPGGDEALRAVAAALRDATKRAGDLVARMGGEEFVACLPQTDLHGAQTAADTMRQAVERLQIPHRRAAAGVVTVSIGCATARHPATLAGQVRTLIAAADRALYDAKAAGRNHVVSVELSDDASTEDPGPWNPLSSGPHDADVLDNKT